MGFCFYNHFKSICILTVWVVGRGKGTSYVVPDSDPHKVVPDQACFDDGFHG